MRFVQMGRIASTAETVELCTAAIWPAISAVAFPVCTRERHDSEATTGEARRRRPPARPLDRGVERQQMGLAGHVRDELDHVAVFGAACASEGRSDLLVMPDFAAAIPNDVVGRAADDSSIEVRQLVRGRAASLDMVEASFEVWRRLPRRCEALREGAKKVGRRRGMATALRHRPSASHRPAGETPAIAASMARGAALRRHGFALLSGRRRSVMSGGWATPIAGRHRTAGHQEKIPRPIRTVLRDLPLLHRCPSRATYSSGSPLQGAARSGARSLT